MDGKKLYSIGEVSEISNVSTKTLRYYDQLGLLSPGIKNPETMYRYYTKEQIFNVFLIKKLQGLGFSLKEIQNLVAVDQPEMYSIEIAKKMEELQKKIDAMNRVYTEGIMLIDKLEMARERLDYFVMKSQGEQLLTDQDSDLIRLEHIPVCHAIHTHQRMENYNNVEISIQRWFEMFKLAEKRALPVAGSIILTYHTQAPLEQFFKSTCDLEVMLPVDTGEKEYADIKSFGGFKAAVALHFGDYQAISATHLKLLKWVEEQGLKLNGHISEEYIISPVDIKTQSGYITKVIAPVE